MTWHASESENDQFRENTRGQFGKVFKTYKNLAILLA